MHRGGRGGVVVAGDHRKSPPASVCHSPGDGCSTYSATSRCSPSARSTWRSSGSVAVSPYTASRSGRSSSIDPLRMGSSPSGSSAAERRDADLVSHRPPQARLPGVAGFDRLTGRPDVFTICPGADHLGTAAGICREQPGDLGGGAEPVGPGRAVDVALDEPQPRLVDMPVDGGEHVGGECAGLPRIGGYRQLGNGSQHLLHQMPRRRELDIGDDPVTDPSLGKPESDPLGEPPFDTPGRHRNQLRRERIFGRDGKPVDEQIDERVRMRSYVKLYRHRVPLGGTSDSHCGTNRHADASTRHRLLLTANVSVRPDTVADMERMPSLTLVLNSLERERDRQQDHFDSVDTKAGVVLGFSGVLAAIALEAWHPLELAALAVSLLASSFAVGAFWPRRLPVLEPRALRRYLEAEERITQLTLVDTYLPMIEQARDVLDRKVRRLKGAMVLLGIAALAAATGGITG